MRSIWIVAKNTVKEILRDRILYGLIVFAVLFVGVSILLGDLSFAQQEKIITDFGLMAVELGCCMLAIFVGSSLVSREIEKQTILLLISKPVKRSHFLIGKVVGLGAVIVVVDFLVSAFLAIVVRQFGTVHWSQFAISQGGVLLESLLMLSFVIFFGTFAKPTMTAIFSLSIWLVGHGINDLYYFSNLKYRSDATKAFGSAVSRVFPNLDYFNFREAAVYGDLIPFHNIQRGFLVWIAWSTILLFLSKWIFERRDFI